MSESIVSAVRRQFDLPRKPRRISSCAGNFLMAGYLPGNICLEGRQEAISGGTEGIVVGGAVSYLTI